MSTIKDRNGMDLTEAEDIKKRWQEYTELYKKDLHDPGNHSVIFEITSKYCISVSFVDHDGHSISSEGFLPFTMPIFA